MASTLRIGNASGYWGDDLTALRRQIDGGPIDVVTMDFLAEITMSILQKQLTRRPEAGYARDFVDQMADVMADALRRNVVIISNAGGVRPDNCLHALQEIAREQRLSPRFGVVAGDDVLKELSHWRRAGIDLSNMDDGRSFDAIADRVSSANVYFGAAPVAHALAQGAQIVVTGRVTDTGITLAPMMHRFGWTATDYDQLAAGIVAGHILECGAQSTGGNFTDFERVGNFHEIGYPICEMSADGSFVITKHEGSGGLVDVATVKEQLVYEMGDPRGYITPDVVADFTSIRLEPAGRDRVRVFGIRGAAPTDRLKVSVSYADGYKASGAVIVCGPKARAKCELFAEIFWRRLPRYDATLTEYVGADAVWGPLSPTKDASEILLRFGARDRDAAKLERFSKMLPALILSGPPGVAVTGGRPPVAEVVAYWPCLIPRHLVRATVDVVGGGPDRHDVLEFAPAKGSGRVEIPSLPPPPATLRLRGKRRRAPLSSVAHGRSGDKGDTCNIGIVARHPAIYPWLCETLSAEFVRQRFAGIAHGRVERFEVPHLGALNFLLHEALGGGGTLSLRIDAQGKTLSHALLACELDIDEELLALAAGATA
jgi:hypothetical protein